MRWFYFILSHSIFISLCAVALCLQTYLLLNIKPVKIVLMLVFSATLSSYNLYWLISKHYFNKEILRFFLKKNISYLLICILAALAVFVCIYFIPHVIPFVATAVMLTLLYSLPLWPFRFAVFPGKVGFIKTLLLAFTWAFVTVMLPLKGSMLEITSNVFILFIARFSFMLMLCTIFDSRDVAIDRIHGLRSLATDVSRQKLNIFMGFVFLVYLGAGFILRIPINNIHQLFAFLITGLVVLFVYLMSLKKRGYIFYYFIVDGLMLFSGIATFVACN